MRRAERGHGCRSRGTHARDRGAPARAARTPWVWSAATVVLLAGCSGAPRPIAPPEAATDTGSAADGDWLWSDSPEDAPDNSLAAMLAQQAADLERMTQAGPETGPETGSAGSADTPDALAPEPRFASPAPLRLERPAAGRTDEPHTPTPNDALLRALSLAGGGTGLLAEQALEAPGSGTGMVAADPSETTPPPDPAESRSLRIAELTNELAQLLKDESRSLEDPMRALVPTALLSALAGGVIDEADLPGGGPLMLTDGERHALRTLRELAVRLVAEDAAAAGDPHRIREILLSTAEQLREHARVRIATAELCVRAPGFGSFVPLPRRVFLAGRTQRLVVYAEVEHFGLRPATQAEATTPGDAVAAELTQHLELYLREGDPQPTWQRTIDWLPKTSRRSFRDMFVATAIELPATLSVGEYDLKLRIVDEVTGAQDETLIPIRIVADASALDGEPATRADRGTGFTPSFASRDSRPPQGP
ncbi:MAG: hypothetical protein ACTS22_07505 [Phycisphaerales bacterium]